MVGSLTRLSIVGQVVSCSRTISPRTLFTYKQHTENDYSWGVRANGKKVHNFKMGLKVLS